MIRIIPYLWCTHPHTSSLSFIVLLIKLDIIGNIKVREAVLFIECNFSTQLHTTSLTYIIFVYNFITILLQLLPWSHTRRCWNNRCHNWGTFSFSIQTDIIMLYYTKLYSNAWSYDLSILLLSSLCYVCALKDIIFIILSIWSIIVGISAVRAVVCFEWIQFSSYSTHSIFSMHSHPHLITHIYYLHFYFYHTATTIFTVKRQAPKYCSSWGVVDRSEGGKYNFVNGWFLYH